MREEGAKRLAVGCEFRTDSILQILSFDKALPLQIHPNKALAAELHAQDPNNFTDTNHKPEISVALSKFELFIGWRPLDSISPLFKIPSLRQFVPEGTEKWTDETLRTVVRNILKADELTIKRIEKELFLRLSKGGDSEALLSSEMQDQIFKLLSRLQDQYTATDPGSLIALLCMNYLVLERGEAVFIPADGIHAYLSGDIVECMARSNNMLAAGLCPVADRNNIDLFAKTLTFSSDTKDFYLPAKSTSDGLKGHTTVYQPPISEFDMLRTTLASNEEERLRSHKGPKVAIVVSGLGKVSGDGKGLEAKEGYIFYIAPGLETTWKAESDMEIFTALVRVAEN